MQKYLRDLIIIKEVSHDAFLVVLLSEHSEVIGPTCNYFPRGRTKTLLLIVFSQSSKFNIFKGPPFTIPPSFQVLYDMTLQCWLPRGDTYFPTPWCGLPLWLALAQRMPQRWECGTSESRPPEISCISAVSHVSLLCHENMLRLACLRMKDHRHYSQVVPAKAVLSQLRWQSQPPCPLIADTCEWQVENTQAQSQSSQLIQIW